MHRLGLRSLPILTTALLFTAGCSDTTPALTSATDGTESDSDSDSATTTGSSTATTTATDTGTTTATGTASASGTGMACIPGMSISCACPEGDAGAQVCEPDGMSYGPCTCEGASSDPTTTDPTTTDPTTTDPTTTDPTTGTTTDDTTTGTTTGVNSACDEVIQFEMMPDEATLTGGWGLAMSMMGEGQIAFIQNPNMGGSVLYEPELPCDDTWYIWARAFDNGQDDSYFATLDGEPEPPAIFEGDCGGGGNGYVWARLNWRDVDANPCEYVEDPWAPTWDAGVHAIEFSYREAQAMGRILITNDPDFTP